MNENSYEEWLRNVIFECENCGEILSLTERQDPDDENFGELCCPYCNSLEVSISKVRDD
ncbi:hypothetical protein [Limnoraphis robusta]|uniref:Uncharacterized protein n=1 Tax=Limnoraphis robusta CCNP1315 TaxID=3110306 RepID=A0ABU5U7N5_9CYAN|nr:hypothetical protein [Limnoraphis robusta]MEA5498018.1 hypothetical protein [Limnoraphis robusta BA-68 BA1]MEA5522867.1 hypothetical protein [Limnoraphis robusta CCNP1315]MEA5546871.1 hypothetical protein [Limnoraphis robusta CCNP1324]